jgi:hypothetical protein
MNEAAQERLRLRMQRRKTAIDIAMPGHVLRCGIRAPQDIER